jgi:hypothetical protein
MGPICSLGCFVGVGGCSEVVRGLVGRVGPDRVPQPGTRVSYRHKCGGVSYLGGGQWGWM